MEILNNKILKSSFLRWSVVSAYTILIFAMSSMSVPDEAIPNIVNFDKFAHFTEFGILCALIFWAFLSHQKNAFEVESVDYFKKRLVRIALISIAMATAYGASDEFHQSFLAFRSSDICDWLADTAGAGAAGFACMFIMRSYADKTAKLSDSIQPESIKPNLTNRSKTPVLERN